MNIVSEMRPNTSDNKELQILNEVELSPDITQRQLAKNAGIALGLTNALLRNLIKKGYLRSQQASWKRWVYFLTPEGISHKIRLTVNYIKQFLNHYSTVRAILREQIEVLNLHEESRVAIVGTGEFAELVFLGLKEIGINEIDVFGSELTGDRTFLGINVRSIVDLLPQEFDRVLIASFDRSSAEVLFESHYDPSDVNNFVTFFNGTSLGVID